MLFFYKSANIFSRYSMWKCFPKTAAAFKMTAPTFNLFTNKNKLQVHHCAIVLRQLRFLFVANKSAKLRGVGFPGDAVTNFLVTFQHVNVARWLAVRCTLRVALIWHFDRCRGRACLAGCLNSLFLRVVDFRTFGVHWCCAAQLALRVMISV